MLVAENLSLLKIRKLSSKVHSSVSVKILWCVQCSLNASEFIHLSSGSGAMLYYVIEEKNCFENPCFVIAAAK